jgi:hypothetical protein
MQGNELPNIPFGEDELVGEGAVAEIADTATDELDILLGKSVDVDSITKRIPEPNRTPVDFSGEIDPETFETFDAEDDIITTVETPAIPAYIPPAEPAPLRVEKRHKLELGAELAKAWKDPSSVKAWILREKNRGETRDSLVKFAEKHDPKMAEQIAYCWDTLDEPTWKPGDAA